MSTSLLYPLCMAGELEQEIDDEEAKNDEEEVTTGVQIKMYGVHTK